MSDPQARFERALEKMEAHEEAERRWAKKMRHPERLTVDDFRDHLYGKKDT